MKNIWTIFKNDLRHLGANSITWMVVVGLVVLPSLYAWPCLYAFWDPYNHTEHLQVAVASVDEGYESDLLPLDLNLGKEVLEALRENNQMDWIFVEKNEAIDGVKSGKYYAALVIPEDFSRDLLSILSRDLQPAEIDYYLNEKENAIAAKVTGQGANAVQKAIDETFASTAAGLILNSMQNLSRFVEDGNAEELTVKFETQLMTVTDDLENTANTLEQLCLMNESLDGMLDASDALLTSVGENTRQAVENWQTLQPETDSLKDVLQTVSGKSDAALAQVDAAYEALDLSVARYLADMDTDARTVGGTLDVLAQEVQQIINRFTVMQSGVETLVSVLPERMISSRTLLNNAAASLDRSIRDQEQIRDSLNQASSNLTTLSSDSVRYQRELSSSVASGRQGLENIRRQFRNDVQPELQRLSDSIEQTRTAVSVVTGGLHETTEGIRATVQDTASHSEDLNGTLRRTEDLLRETASKSRLLLERLQDGGDESTQTLIQQLLNSSSDSVSSYVSSAVQLETHAIYPVSNFGSGVAPYYTCLAIWFGALIQTAMLKTKVSEKALRKIKKLRSPQVYLGRAGIFVLLSLMQTLLLALGDLFFLGIDCKHPVLFVVTCLYLSLVFTAMIYTLAAALGNIGKAIAVILMVFQVASSGGTIPVEMTPPFFHWIYPLLPVTHGMNAMRECTAGMYDHYYLQELGVLSIYLVAALVLGLIFCGPLSHLNERFVETLEKTKVM